MTALIHWVTGHPARVFLAAGLASFVALIALPMAAWLPAGVLVAANTVSVSVVETNATAQALLTPQVVLLDGLAGSNSAGLASGVFTPIALLASRAAAGAGKLLSGGLILSEGFILSESADPASLGDASLLGQP